MNARRLTETRLLWAEWYLLALMVAVTLAFAVTAPGMKPADVVMCALFVLACTGWTARLIQTRRRHVETVWGKAQASADPITMLALADYLATQPPIEAEYLAVFMDWAMEDPGKRLRAPYPDPRVRAMFDAIRPPREDAL